MDQRPGKKDARTNQISLKPPGSVSARTQLFREQKQPHAYRGTPVQKVIHGVHLGPILFNAGLSPKGTSNIQSMRCQLEWIDSFNFCQTTILSNAEV